MSQKETKFELMPAPSAAVEKRLAAHKKNLAAYVKGMQSGAAQLFGYRFLAGREMLMARELLPHGELRSWVEEQFPGISERTSRNWMAFAEAVLAKTATVADLKSVAGPLQLDSGKVRFSAKEHSLIARLVPDIMDGAGMVEFMREARLLKEPPKATHHPIKMTAKDKAEAERREAQDTIHTLIELLEHCGPKLLAHAEDAQLKRLERARLTLGENLKHVKGAK
jgi:hypothetical protein